MSAPIAEARRTRILLSADEWHVLTSRVNALHVPVEFVSDWTTSVSGADRDRREGAAVTALQQRKLIDGTADAGSADLTDSLHPALGAVLSLPQVASTVIDIAAWGPSRSVLQSLSVAGGFCLGLARTQQVQNSNERADAGPRVLDENSVEVTACGVADLIDEALRSLDLVDDRSSTGSGPVSTVSVADASALVLAMRTGDAAIIQEALRRVGSGQKNTGFGAIAGTITGGFLLRVHDPRTGKAWAPAWFFTDAGWVRLGMDIGSEPATAEALTENGRVSCRPVSRVAITADVTAALLSRLGLR